MKDTMHLELTRRWTFYGFAGLIDSEFKPENVREMTIDFRENNKVTGRSSCNVFGGDYSITEDNSISVSDLFSTYMCCGDNTMQYWEEKYIHGLENAVSYEILDDQLIINTGSGVKMIFGTY